MGKGKKKFIEKGEGRHYHVVHRSQRDEAFLLGDEKPSEFVLLPSTNDPSSGLASGLAGKHANLFATSTRDHIDPLGFKNDGYDYSQHLKVVNGGQFVNKDGKVVHRPHQIDLPEDVLASEVELARDFQAITISEEFMDEDIREALFGDDSDAFEELDDDFVAQVMQEPVVPDFDFDAHIARLIELSERTLKGDNKEAAQARGWDDATLKGRFLKQKRNTAGVEKYDMDENEFNYSDGDGSESDESDLSEDALELYKEDANHSDDNDDGDFDKLLEQYSEHHLGYEEDEDITIEGAIDLAAGSNALLEAAMDEFLQEQLDRDRYEGLKDENYAKIKKSLEIFRSYIVEDNEINAGVEPTDIKKEYHEQMRVQAEMAEQYPEHVGNIRRALTDFREITEDDDEATREKKLNEIFQNQEYLRNAPVRERWDCETILSTYSTLDNHPTVIKDPKSKFKPYKSKFERSQEPVSDSKSVTSRVTRFTSLTNPTRQVQQQLQINAIRNTHSSLRDNVPINTTNLLDSSSVSAPVPVSYVTSTVADFVTQPASSVSIDPTNHIATVPVSAPASTVISTTSNFGSQPASFESKQARATTTNYSNQLSELDQNKSCDDRDSGNNESDDSGDESSDSGNSRVERNDPKRIETKEEKKLRKKLVKEDRRTRRAAKKQLKTAFKTEMTKFNKPVSVSEKLCVYKYSN